MTFFQRRYTNGQQAHEEMLNIMKQQGNANQNYLTPVSMTIIKKTIRSIGKELEEGEHSWESKLVQLIWKTEWWFLKKLKIELLFLKELKAETQMFVHLYSWQH